jgi:hypothetical protein
MNGVIGPARQVLGERPDSLLGRSRLAVCSVGSYAAITVYAELLCSKGTGRASSCAGFTRS